MQKFKFTLATSSWDEAEINAMQNVIATGNFTMGEKVEKFQIDFATYFGSKYCVMVNSGSSANLLMIAALFYTKDSRLRLKKGDEVIVPAISWSTTYYPLYQYGLKIKFVDVDLETLNYDLNQLNEAVNENTKLIVAVNLLGNPNNFQIINEIIEKNNIILIEDNCESLGAKFNNKYTGTFGIMGSFSTFYSHHISTMEGGMIVTDNEELFHILLSLRAHGWTRNLPEVNYLTGTKDSDPFVESFRFVLPGYNLRPLELEGAIGIEQVKKLDSIINNRRINGSKVQKLFSNHPDLLIQKEIGESSWFGFSLVIRPQSNLTREVLIVKLNELGFETRPIVTGNFAKNEVVKYFDSEIFGKLENASHIDKNGLFIGNHHFSMDEAMDTLSLI
jgi:CDP-6-deoxy-D-xylo-4-hexulose-3-dehydrase